MAPWTPAGGFARRGKRLRGEKAVRLHMLFGFLCDIAAVGNAKSTLEIWRPSWYNCYIEFACLKMRQA